MKNLRNITLSLLLVVLPLSSCDKWLEATSSTQLPADKLFEIKSGFYDALTGVYISMGALDFYGGSYTWKNNDLAAFPYEYQQSKEFEAWQKHQYTTIAAKNGIKGMWSCGYSTLANINMILRELDAKREVIPYEDEYNMFKGELLGLRAYIHFDMMRMFGVSDWSGANAGKLCIPYQTKYDKEPEIQRTYAETAQLVQDDIEMAITCLEKDPVTGRQDDMFETSANSEGYWNERDKHMNYYAVNALAARFYQWRNDYAKAAEYAQKVIDGAFAQKLVQWVDLDQLLIGTSDYNKDWSFSSEHLFSLEVTRLQEYVNSYLLSQTERISVRLLPDFVSGVLFPPTDPQTGSIAGSEDVRGPAFLLRYGPMGYSCYKLYGSSSYEAKYKNRVPMMKISEMYYILAEYYISVHDNAKALEMLDVVRKQRGIGDLYPSTADAAEELMKEYYREFMCEGQLFYYLKHKKVSSSLWKSFVVDEQALIYPYPDEEINYGRKQEL